MRGRKKIDEKYTALTPDPTSALSESFLRTPSVQEVKLALEGNRTTTNDPDILKAPAHCEKSLENAAACYDVDSILDVTDNTWRLYQFNRVTNKSTKILEGPAGSTGTYFTWIRKKLRYDGLVLDEKDGFLLALIPNQRYPRDSQALTIRNSSQKILVSASESKGSGLIQLHSYVGEYEGMRGHLQFFNWLTRNANLRFLHRGQSSLYSLSHAKISGIFMATARFQG